MSGKPYPKGVSNLSEQFRLLEDARSNIAVYCEQVATAQEKLNAAKGNEELATRRIHELMQEMDIHAPGNTGYKERLLWTLRELNTQAEQYGRTHQ